MKMLCPPAGAFLPRRPWAFDHDHAFPTRRSSDLVALAVAPRVMNGAALTVLTGSMEPTYSPGDMVVSVPQDRYDVGDVVTFQPVSGDPMLITHRVVAIQLGGPGGTRYVTRGRTNGTE